LLVGRQTVPSAALRTAPHTPLLQVPGTRHGVVVDAQTVPLGRLVTFVQTPPMHVPPVWHALICAHAVPSATAVDGWQTPPMQTLGRRHGFVVLEHAVAFGSCAPGVHTPP
jgi:hypothetical protein